jgi:hypothetical protein
MISAARTQKTLWVLLFVAVVLNAGLWLGSRHLQARWLNVPPVPSAQGLKAGSLGDPQFTYRNSALMIQNLGDTGGRTTPLRDYDYERLSRWFHVVYALDNRSSVIPFLAAYYFSAVQDKTKLRPLVEFLELTGERDDVKSWRWLAQAVFLARYELGDLDYALKIAHKLSAANNPDLPIWARQMPAMIMATKGDKTAAYAIMVETLRTQSDSLHPNEVNFMVHYICEQILDKAAANLDPLCKGLEGK